MDRCYFIDKETFEVYKEHPNVFSVDPRIANTVSMLNKLGYYTLASCEGHWEIKEYDISVPKENRYTGIYILYKEYYDFPNIPEGFELEKEDRITLRYTMEYYDEYGNHRNRFEFEREKEKYCKIIEDWANQLPERER